MEGNISIPVVGVIGWSGSGKTVLIEKLVAEFVRRGYRVGTVKHSRDPDIEFDTPGSDTWRHLDAGSEISVLASPGSLATFERMDDDPSLKVALSRISAVDLVLVEGYKRSAIPKIVLASDDPADDLPLAERDRKDVIAILAAPGMPQAASKTTILDRDNVVALANLIQEQFSQHDGSFA